MRSNAQSISLIWVDLSRNPYGIHCMPGLCAMLHVCTAIREKKEKMTTFNRRNDKTDQTAVISCNNDPKTITKLWIEGEPGK